MARPSEVRFHGRVAVITGAGRGLGLAYARLLAERGATVVVNDAGVAQDGSGGDPSLAEAAAASIVDAGGQAVASGHDLSTLAGCETLIDQELKRFGRIDVLINNAGIGLHQAVEEVDAETWTRLLAVNVSAPFWLSRCVFPVMRRQRYGRIVFTISGHAMFLDPDTTRDLAAYSTGKGAQFGLMNALASEGHADGIRVNAISPVAATRMFTRHVEPGTLLPEQVAPGVAFLASDRCTFSGVVLRARSGRFSTGWYSTSPGVDLGSHPVAPEEIEASWPAIRAPQGLDEPSSRRRA
jgi:NAD(P)-dependent dehydrogenase (short-subunit alcohol dehydrogenase family)